MSTLIPSSPSTKPPMDTAIELACNACFHRSLTLPATASHEALKVTFATTSNFERGDGDGDDALPVMLFCGPMGGTRYMLMDIDHVANEAGVRIVFIDRPGFGASTSVPLDQRINVWIETVPAVLERLRVRHVALVSHSAGTLYALNTLLRLTGILDPVRPTAILLAPWVHPECSGAGLMNWVSKLPRSWIGSVGSINSFVGSTVMPSIGYSAGLLESMSNVFRSDDVHAAIDSESEDSARKLWGLDLETVKEIEKLQRVYRLSECPKMEGASQDALLCLKKGGRFWGACDDYAVYVTELTNHLQELMASGRLKSKLAVKAIFSESDLMIGKGGMEYFEKCFNVNDMAGGEVMSFQSQIKMATNHDSVLSPAILQSVFKEFKAGYQSI